MITDIVPQTKGISVCLHPLLGLFILLAKRIAHIPEVFETAMNSLGYEYQGDFARRYYGQGKAEGKVEGKAEGKAEGRIELILKLLALRFGPLTEAAQARVRGAQDAQLDALAERMLTAKTLEEALN